MIPYRPLKSTDLATDLATLSDLESVTIRVRIDLDDDLLDGNARCLVAADRLQGGAGERERLSAPQALPRVACT